MTKKGMDYIYFIMSMVRGLEAQRYPMSLFQVIGKNNKVGWRLKVHNNILTFSSKP